MNRRERRAAAKGAKSNPSKAGLDPAGLALQRVDPRLRPSATPATLHQAALGHLSGGRLLDAQACCQQALAIDPEHVDTLHLMGVLALQAKQPDHAVEWFSRAIRLAPRPEYLASLGVALKQQGRLADALGVFDKAVQLKPDDADLWKHLAGALLALERPADALLAYQHALTLNPRQFEAAFQVGILLHRLERFEDALAQFDLCDRLQPAHAATLQWRGRALRSLKRLDEALADSRRAHALDPGDPFTCNNIGDALVWLGRAAEGLPWFDKALALRPDLADVLINKGFALIQLHRFDEAVATYERALRLAPDHAKGAYHLAHLHLLLGNYEAGWAAREQRWKMPDYSPGYRQFAVPLWLGETPIEGRTILIHGDEGFGDTLQFARYVPLLAARGARVLLMVQDALVSLLSGLPGIVACIASSAATLPPHDLHCPVMSLPLAFATRLDTIPPPLALPPPGADRIAAWEDRLGPRGRLRVGLVWSGNPRQTNDHNRSMSFSTLVPLLDCEATFISLQKDVRSGDAAALAAHPGILDPTADIADFRDTAALISCLDLVITVCTSVAHLSATLGRPTWVMLPYVPDWRWLCDRDDSPWYPGVRLFRQDVTGSYVGVVDRVRGALTGHG